MSVLSRMFKAQISERDALQAELDDMEVFVSRFKRY